MSNDTKITIQNLLTVKSIVTISLTIVFGYLAIKGTITGEQFLTIFSVVIAFYFGMQSQKNAETSSDTVTANENSTTETSETSVESAGDSK